MPQDRKILVTGATGFVGAHAVNELISNGWQVRCLLRETSDRSKIPESVEIVTGSLANIDDLKRAVRDCNSLMHIAGLVRALSLADFMRVNRDATANLVRAARDSGVERFLLCSSQAAGGPSYDGRPRRADDPCEPVTDYGQSKLAGEQALQQNAGNMWWCIIRPPAVYGPNDRAFLTFVRWVNLGFKLRLGNGKGRFAIIHGEDLARAMRMGIEADIPSGQIFYATDGGEWTLFDMGRAVESAMGRKAVWIPIPLSIAPAIAVIIEFIAKMQGGIALLSRQKVRELSQSAWICDSETFQRRVEFSPKYNLFTGMAQTIAWYRENGWI